MRRVCRIITKWVDSDVLVEGPPSPATGNAFVCFVNSTWVFVVFKEKKNAFFDFRLMGVGENFFFLFFQRMCLLGHVKLLFLLLFLFVPVV